MIGGVPGGDAEGVVRLSAALVVIFNATLAVHGAALVGRDATLAGRGAALAGRGVALAGRGAPIFGSSTAKEVHGDTEGCLFAGDEGVGRTRLTRKYGERG